MRLLRLRLRLLSLLLLKKGWLGRSQYCLSGRGPRGPSRSRGHAGHWGPLKHQTASKHRGFVVLARHNLKLSFFKSLPSSSWALVVGRRQSRGELSPREALTSVSLKVWIGTALSEQTLCSSLKQTMTIKTRRRRRNFQPLRPLTRQPTHTFSAWLLSEQRDQGEWIARFERSRELQKLQHKRRMSISLAE